MSNLTLGSLFDGSGGFPFAGILSGITPIWASEIEPFPIRVTTKRLPGIKHYGDVSKMKGSEIEPVDIITFGSPCQDMSVAGKRAGLDGSRSNLFYEAIRVIKEMRCATDGKYPRYIVWENVPGAFSSNKGEDFRCVLESICRVKDETVFIPGHTKWNNAGHILGRDFSLAWRIFDAQYWGVPQRRKRIYLVADFDGKCADKILFKSESLSWHPPESFHKRQGTAGCIEDGSGTPGKHCNGIVLNDQGGSRMDITDEQTSTLRAEAHHPPCVMESAGFCTEHSAKSRTIGYEEELSPTLRAGVVPATVAIENHPADSRVSLSDADAVQTLTSRMGTGGGNVPLVMKIRSGCEGGGKGALINENKSLTLSCNNDQTVFSPCNWDGAETAPTLTARNAGGAQRMPDKDNFNCVLQPFGISAKDSNAMKSPNPHSGIYEAETSRTIDTSGSNPASNQGGIVVCVDQGGGKSSCSISENISPTLACTHGGEPAVCQKETDSDVYSMTTGYYTQIEKEKSPTLLSRDYKDPAVVTQPNTNEQVIFAIDREAFNSGKTFARIPGIKTDGINSTLNAQGPGAVAYPYGFDPAATRDVGQYFLENCGNTLVNGTCPGHHNGVCENGYSVRRLTPTECARLQGFPDWWCDDLATENPSMDEIREWYDIFETHRKVCGTSEKPKSLKQIIKWLKAPYSDSAEYKMWGNGIALPCAFFVLSSIVYNTQSDCE